MTINLENGQEFYLLVDTSAGKDYFGQLSPVPTAPTNPVTEIWLCESLEKQTVTIDGNYRVTDSNNSYGLIVGGRPKCRRK